MAGQGRRASGCSRLGPVPVGIPRERGDRAVPHTGLWARSIHGALPAPGCGRRDGGQCPQQPLSRGSAVFSSLSRSPSALPTLGLRQIPPGSCQKRSSSRNTPAPWTTPKRRYPQPALLWLPSRAPLLRTRCGSLLFPARPSLQVFWECFEPSAREGSAIAFVETMAKARSSYAESAAALLDMLVESEVSTLKQVSNLWVGLEPPGESCGP